MSCNTVRRPQRIVRLTEEGPAALTDGVRQLYAIIQRWAEIRP